MVYEREASGNRRLCCQCRPAPARREVPEGIAATAPPIARSSSQPPPDSATTRMVSPPTRRGCQAVCSGAITRQDLISGIVRIRLEVCGGYLSRTRSGSVQHTVNPTSLDERRPLRRSVPHHLHIPARSLRLSAMARCLGAVSAFLPGRDDRRVVRWTGPGDRDHVTGGGS